MTNDNHRGVGSPPRLKALDVLRGLTIAAMIVVSTPGSWDHVFIPVTHAAWDGTTPTDLIFPFFLFMMGTAVPLALSRYAGKPDLRAYGRIARRVGVIFVLGILLNLYPAFDFANYGWRGIGYTGVLQRIALVYLACALLYLHVQSKARLALGAAILLIHWMLCLVGAESAQPGANLPHRIDQFVLGLDPGAWVPEGFTTTFPAIVTSLIGVHVGEVLQRQATTTAARTLLVTGFALLLAGIAWSWQAPLNKNLWSSSFVLYSAGWAALALAALVELVDVRGLALLNAAVPFGVNAITFYVGFHLLHPIIYALPLVGGQSLAASFMQSVPAELVDMRVISLGFAVLFTFILWLIARCLAARRLIIRV